ncbi:Flp pilus assembly protein TadG [Arthrobacter ulcerisalmonis]|nr:Flp pilus assembly protein TadG [Arthrobacter ulcerisalmonis]
MRRLSSARRVATANDNERGVAGVLVALMMLVLIGAGALAVDVGQIYAERAQLQNGADAAALAVAKTCHKSGCDQAAADALAKDLANANANDGGSKVLTPVDLTQSKRVTVRTSTAQGKDGPGFLSKMFASALNAPPASVGAYAIAVYGPPSSGGGFPLAFSNKCWDLAGGVETGALQKVSWKPGTTCTNPSGTIVPGGWGWLLDPDNDCYAVTSTGNAAGSDPGSDKPDQCKKVLESWIATLDAHGTVDVPFPVFDTTTGVGKNAVYHIIGYATFQIWGWKFGNNSVYEYHNKASDLEPKDKKLACSGGEDRCIIGKFVKFETTSSGGGGTDGVDLGTAEVRLVTK